jgi:hypothetical protein
MTIDAAEPRIHPCLCGFTCDKYSQMKHHRESCADWQNRPNPLSMMIARRKKTRNERTSEGIKVERCQYCRKRLDHHDAACPDSQGEAVRRARLKKHDIDPMLFEVFLRCLARKYEPEPK